jgi:hypothetical protein
MTKQILVQFTGEGSGVGDLTWGQLDIWAAMQRESSSLSLGGAFPLPPGTTVDDVAADLRFLICRNTSLRTRIRRAADGRLEQAVEKSGEIALEVVDPGDADPGEVAAALFARYEDKVFDHFSEWPIWWSVVGRRGAATHLVTLISHLATDGMGAMSMLADLASRDPETGRARGPVTALQPLEIARRERAPAARRQSSAAMRYWERTLRAIPARRFAAPADPQSPRYWQASYDSPAALGATQLLAVRTQASTATVLMAAWAVVLTRVTGRSPAVIQVLVNNRFRRDLADVVTPLCISIPCVIDVAGATFDEVVAQAWSRAVNAYKLSYYDPTERDKLIARIERERGETIDISSFVNDRRMRISHEPEAGQPLPAAGDLLAALPRSTLTWGKRRDQSCERSFLHVNDVADSLSLELWADTRYLGPGDIEACLRGVEATVVEAALDPAAGAGIRAS